MSLKQCTLLWSVRTIIVTCSKKIGSLKKKLKKLKPHLGNELEMATVEDRILQWWAVMWVKGSIKSFSRVPLVFLKPLILQRWVSEILLLLPLCSFCQTLFWNTGPSQGISSSTCACTVVEDCARAGNSHSAQVLPPQCARMVAHLSKAFAAHLGHSHIHAEYMWLA